MFKISLEPNELKCLEYAALTGDLEEVEYFTRNALNQSTEHYNILKKTIISGQIEVAKLLINRGCQLTEKLNPDEAASRKNSVAGDNKSEDFLDENDNILLHLAVAAGSLELVKILLLKGFSTEILDKDGIPFFFKIVDSPFNKLQSTELLNYLITKIDEIDTRWESRGFTILHYALEKQNFNIIPLLLKKNFNVNAKSKDGSTPLHLAVKNGKSEIVELLLNNTADDTIFNEDELTPLCLAIKKGDFNIFKILLEFSRRFEIFRKQRALHIAIETENLEIINTLIKRELDFRNIDSKSVTSRHVENLHIFSALLNVKEHDKLNTGLTALNLAAKVGNSEVVSLLLEKGADCKAVDANNKTPLSVALENSSGNVQTLEILLNHIRQVKNDENDYLTTAEEQVLKEYCLKAREDKTGNSALHLAVQEEDKTAVNLILKHNACIRVVNQNGYTPFDLAIVNGSLSMVNIFLKSQDDPEALFLPKKLDGYTPMHLAVEMEKLDVLQLFFKARISPDISKSKGLTPLHIAVQRNNKDLIMLLLKNGAKVDVCGRFDFETPLFTAAELGYTEAIEILTEVSSTWPSKCKEADLFMYIAAYNGHENAVKMFLALGVDPHVNVNKCLTPLHAAAQKGHESIVKLLLEYGAQINPETKGRLISTPLLAASYAGYSKIVKLLLDYGADLNVKLEYLSENAYLESYQIWLSNNSFNLSDPVAKFWNYIKHPEDKASVPNTQQILIQGNYKDSEVGEEGVLLGSTSFHLAVVSGNEETVKLLIDHGAVLNSTTKYGATPLGLAIENEDKTIINHLLSSGVDIDIPHKCRSIFQIDNLRKNVIITDMLFEYMASQSQFDENSCIKLLRNAVESEYEIMVQKILEARPDLLIEHKMELLLHCAVRKKNLMIIKILLKYGIDVNACEDENVTALSVAVSINEPNIVQLLLDAGAKIETFSYFLSKHPLCKAIVANNTAIVEMFLMKGLNDNDFKKSFFRAVSLGNPQIVQKYLDFGASIDMKNSSGRSPLFMAIRMNKLCVLRFLLKKGASWNTLTKGKTILEVALNPSCKLDHDNSLKIIELLIENFVDVNFQDEKGCSPIDMLFESKYYTEPSTEREIKSFLLKLFLFNGADPNYINKKTKTTLLMSAIERNDIESVKLLILNGIDINNLGNYHRGYLELAIQVYDDNYRIASETGWTNSVHVTEAELSFCVIGLLKQEIARRLFLNEEVNKKYTLDVPEDYYDNHLKELELMKVTEICKGVSYFDILRAKYCKLVSLCGNKFVRSVLMPGAEVHKLFPLYAATIVGQIEIGSDRKRLLNSSYYLLEKVLRYKFPYAIVDYVFSFLSNRDLKNINQAINNDIFNE